MTDHDFRVGETLAARDAPRCYAVKGDSHYDPVGTVVAVRGDEVSMRMRSATHDRPLA